MRNLACLLALLAGCGESAPKPADITIDPAIGGTVALSDGTAAVVIPAATLTAPTRITVAPDSTVPPASLGAAVSGTFRFGPEGMQFQKPVTVTLAVDLSKLPSGHTLAEVFIATAPAGSTAFERMATTVVDSNHVSAQTSHFSLFAALLSGSQF